MIEAKSLSRAAAELGIPRATVARRLGRLEERLGVRLLRRSTRRLSVTDAGERFYRHARIVLDAVSQAQSSVRATEEKKMRGELRVSVPPIIDESFSEMMTSFAKRYPAVRIRVDLSTRMVDLIREGYDVALRASLELQPGLVARTLARDRVIAVASPQYLAEHGTPRALKDLKKHRCLTGFARGELPQSTWPVGKGVVHVDSSFSSNDVRLLREAALRHLGVALLPSVILGDLVDTGALVQVLPNLIGAESRIAVVYPEREFMAPQVRAFIDELVAWAPALQAMLRGRVSAPGGQR